MNFQFTHDAELIRQVLTVPSVFEQMKNDLTPPISQFRVHLPSRTVAILCGEKENPAGVVLLETRTPTTARVHFCFIPSARGSAVLIGRQCLAWIWANSSLLVLEAPAPSHNWRAIRFAEALGFAHTGKEEGVGRKDGKPFDLLILRLKAGRPAQ